MTDQKATTRLTADELAFEAQVSLYMHVPSGLLMRGEASGPALPHTSFRLGAECPVRRAELDRAAAGATKLGVITEQIAAPALVVDRMNRASR